MTILVNKQLNEVCLWVFTGTTTESADVYPACESIPDNIEVKKIR